LLKERCTKGELINPKLAIKMLNEAIKGEDPEAFEPEFVVKQPKKK
jgi:hypothetical protein